MKANGSGITIRIYDAGAHGDTVTATARRYAPGATAEFVECGKGTKIDYQAIKGELRALAANPGRVNIVQLSWGLPGWISESIPPWAHDPEKGMEQELAAVASKGIYIVAAAGDESQGQVGANYPACSELCIPAMGSASFCNRTHRGLVCSESSASRAASELSAAFAVLLSAGASEPYETLKAWASSDEFPVLNVNPPIERHAWKSLYTGRVKIATSPETLLTRYKANGEVHREQFGSMTTSVEEGKETVIGITGGLARHELTMRRAA